MEEQQNETQQYEPQQYVSQSSYKQEKERGRGLAIASLVLGIISLLCCCCLGLGVIPGGIGAVLGLIALINGEGKSRIIGGIGLALSAIGLVISLYMIISLMMTVRWENVTWENFSTFKYINPDDEEQLRQWLQQFFNVDISNNVYYVP